MLVEAASRDDAAVFRLSEERALIATVDFFPPIVDDAAQWGAIACANALSDVYAMGGTPLFALNIVGWPRETLPFELLGDVLAGASDVAQEAGCLIVGGHTIDDPEPKFGLSVIGEVHPDRMMTNAQGRPGDQLILTKPLGTGILTTALKRQRLSESDLDTAVKSMRRLNATAARVAVSHGVRTATDVTGFGLLGHLGNILRHSGVAAEIEFAALPLLPDALDLAREGVVPGGTERNHAALEQVTWDAVDHAEQMLCVDAQTSGGLLLAVSADQLDAVLDDLLGAGVEASRIGRLVEGDPGATIVRRGQETA